MQAITVKYLAPTTTKGTRFRASCAAGSVTIDRDYENETDQDFMKAAEALRDKLGWSGEMQGGHTKDGNAVFVLADKQFLIK